MKFNSTEKSKKNSTIISIADSKKSRFVETNDGLTYQFGIGTEKEVTLKSLRSSMRKLATELEHHELWNASIDAKELCIHAKGIAEETVAAVVSESFLLATYVFSRYKTKKQNAFAELLFRNATKNFSTGIVRGEHIGTAINEARELANTPGGDMTPAHLADSAVRILKGTKVAVKVLKKKDIERLKMGAILGVAKGSIHEPRFIILEYKGTSAKTKNTRPIVFAGKGITFDTGGLNIKPSEGLLDMHLDMSGGAAVIGALKAISALKIDAHVIGLIPSAENSVSGESYRPGDVLTTMSGKTVDVLNTDAEGRLVLADALTYAERYEPSLVIDVATLTGAALVALGQHASAFMTKDDKLADKLSALSELSGDQIWRLPLWNDYLKYTKGNFGDLANIQSSGNARYGGAINGGAFLSHFAEKFSWVHIDTAPRMTAAPGDYLKKGATGEPIRLLIAIAENGS